MYLSYLIGEVLMTDIINILKGITIGQYALIVTGILSLIQIAPIKINPWSWIARNIGRALNKEVMEKQDEFQKESKEYRKNNDQNIKNLAAQIQKREAEDARNRILRFGDEIKSHQRHSEEYYNQILADITDYEQYCHDHPKFKNERTVATEQIIREAYHNHITNNDFL